MKYQALFVIKVKRDDTMLYIDIMTGALILLHAGKFFMIFFKNQLFRKILSGIPFVSNSLDPDQA